MIECLPFLVLRTPLQSTRYAYSPAGNAPALFEEGLYLASPDLWHELNKNGLSDAGMRAAYARYWLRSCTRSTPFGTFAGCSLAAVSDGDSHIVLGDQSSHDKAVRIDMNYFTRIVDELCLLPEIRNHIKFFPNNSHYQLPDEIRYVEYKLNNRDTREYSLTTVERSAYIDIIVQRAAAHGATIEELIDAIIAAKGMADRKDDITRFVVEVIGSQLLTPGIEPCLTGNDPLAELIRQLEVIAPGAHLCSQLKEIGQLLLHPGKGTAWYQLVENALQELRQDDHPIKYPLQVDLFPAFIANKVSRELVNDILSQVEEIMILSRPVVNADLQQFRQEFYQRYGDAEVPLALALDPDWGIGYASPGGQSAESSVFIDDLHAGKRKSAPKLQADAIQELVLRKYIACLENGEDCITLSVTDLQSAAGLSKEAVYSQSMYVIGSLLKNGPGEQDYCFDLQNLWGPSAANLFSRFTYRNEELHRLTTAMLQAEEERSPDTIFAEIVHLPEARVGNILLRPHLRRYEIPYMGKSGLDDAHQLPLDDLLVSVHHNEIILRSKKHGKRVIPRLASAHNFDTPRSLPLYRFLCDLQTQGLYGPAFWDWGLLSQVKHLPRVVFKKLLLKKACWQFDEKDLAILGKDQQRIKSQLPAFRAKWKLPRKISVVEREDHELYIDLESSAGLDLLADLLKKSKSLHIEEFLFNEEHAFVKDVNGDPYSNEVIIPVTVSAAMQYNSDLTATPSVSGIKRNFFPGSEWLYFKIYCGTKYAEKILRNLILDFVEEASQQAGFDKFFFIRYHDTASHIRIRFYNEDISRQVTLQQRFLSLLETQRQTGLIHDMSIHAYTRELERYGEKTMSHIESLFYHDSLTVLRLLRLLGEVEDAEEYRMLFALRGIHMFLDDFGLSLTDKYALIKEMQLNYFREFGGKPALQKQLNDKYRTWQRKIASHMNPDEDEDNGIEEATTLFAERSVLSLPVINDIYHVYAATHLDSKQEVMKILDSCIHMFLNRLFVSRQRKFELVAYHFMERYYYSRQVIEKQKKEKELVKQS